MAMSPQKKKADRLKTVGQIQTPLGFYVLTLLIVESTLTVVLTAADIDGFTSGTASCA